VTTPAPDPPPPEAVTQRLPALPVPPPPEPVTQRLPDLPPPPPKPLQAWRCPRCGTLLLRAWLPPGAVLEIKCQRCKEIIVREVAA